jgi:hypothetical protein
MKKLNGKLYFEKPDIVESKKDAIFYLNHPDENHEFLYIINADERDCVIDGINALFNTLSWEFSSETAINIDTIERCYKSLRVHSTSIMSYDEYYEIKPIQRTQYVEQKFSNWLNAQGHLISYEFLQKLNKYTK